MSYAERTLVICNHGGSDLSFSETMDGDNLTEEYQQILEMEKIKKDHRLGLTFMWFYVGDDTNLRSYTFSTVEDMEKVIDLVNFDTKNYDDRSSYNSTVIRLTELQDCRKQVATLLHDMERSQAPDTEFSWAEASQCFSF